MAYERNRGWDEAPQGISGKTIFVAGLIMLAIGLFVVLRAMTGQASQPPASAQVIPATVGTAVPFPVDPSAVAAALPPSTPVEVEIPVLGVKAPVMRLGRNSDGTVQVPPLGNHNLAGWYDGSVTPGADGSSVILGHVDNYTGPSVFFSIKNLHAGDKVDVVRANGSVAAFAVDGVQKVAKAQFPTSDVYGNVGYPSLRLVTCGGPFDAGSGQYVDNIVVYAHLTGVRTAASALAVNGTHAAAEVGFAPGDTVIGSLPAGNASTVAATTTTFSAAGAQTATVSHLRQGFTSAGSCPDGTCTQSPGTVTISVTVRRHHARGGRHHPGGGPGHPGGGPGPSGGGPGPSGGGPGPSGGGPGPSGGGPVSPGSFTFTVTASAATLAGTVHPLVLGGDLPDMTVTDNRNSRPGWSVRGQVSDFTGSGTAAGSVISGNQLGWTPSGTVTGGATLGRQVDPASPGLGSIPAVLASAAAGSGSGTDTLSAKLLLDVPATAPVGTYNVILTITCVESAP
ncbi:MAG TPA: class F sortase [Streptosporangiaceae bacterium]|nr:class F sortase [Streptosporangiaceae bacterium]